jgi:glycosyltransferase involved in cell wall biosynthesis
VKHVTVLSVTYPFAPLRPSSVGGAEQVLRIVEDAIAREGHRSLVLAARGSICRGTLFEVALPPGTIDDEAREKTIGAYRRAIREILGAHRVDVVHMHGVDFASYLPDEGPALIATLHLPAHFYPPGIFSLGRPRTRYVCVSKRQRESCPPSTVPISLVPNGVLVHEFSWKHPKEDYVLAMGRICPEKGLHDAVDAAKKAGVSLLIAGEVHAYADHLRYFREVLEPRLDDRRKFIGPVGGSAKRDLLGRASCVLIPSLVRETSSLVAMEAFASGTPVVARPVGALLDIVEDGKTGFLASTVEEMATAIDRAKDLDPRACRDAAEHHFSARRMTDAYLDLIGSVVTSSRSMECSPSMS